MVSTYSYELKYTHHTFSVGSFTPIAPSSTLAWGTTHASSCEKAPNLGSLELVACDSVVLKNNDIARLNGFALITYHDQCRPVKILELLATVNRSHFVGMTVQLHSLLPDVEVYGMPGVRNDGGMAFVLLEVRHAYIQRYAVLHIVTQKIMCTLSLFHNCAHHKCSIERTKVIMQERQETSLRGQAVQHSGDLSDLVLNVASLRSAIHIQALRSPPTVPGNVQETARGAVIEWQTEQERTRVEKEKKDEDKEKKKEERERKKEERERKKNERGKKEGPAQQKGKNTAETKRKRTEDDSGSTGSSSRPRI
jgi:hypothetical protein